MTVEAGAKAAGDLTDAALSTTPIDSLLAVTISNNAKYCMVGKFNNFLLAATYILTREMISSRDRLV